MTHRHLTNEWISIRHLRHFLTHGEAAGLESNALLQALGLSRSQLDDPEATLPVAALEPVLADLSSAFPEQPLGLQLAQDVQPATFGVLGLLTQSAPRFADILDLLVRYNGLLSSMGRFSLEHAPGRVKIHWECRAGGLLFRHHAREYVLGSLLVLGHALVPTQTGFPLAVHFPHAPPDDPRIRHRYQSFFGCPVHFDQVETALIADSRILKLSMRHGDPALRRTLEPHADELLRHRHHRRSLTEDVVRLIDTMLDHHDPSATEVSRQLGVSERTLHRKLKHEDTRFRDLLDDVRLNRARTLLRENGASLETLAARVGLQSRQSLIRWFRRRTGMTPGQYRKEYRQ